MSTLFKDIYSKDFFEHFTAVVAQLISGFNKTEFLSGIYDKEWKNRELKQRMRHISSTLKAHLSEDYKESIKQLLSIISHLREKGIKENSIEFMFIPDFIEQYGIEDFNTSVLAIEQITAFTSCEFAVRPFIIRYKERMIKQMLEWTKHPDANVRRLASEGSRPRLPWAMAIPFLKDNPAPVFPVIEALMQDPSEYVRRSVANNLNDISKDNPAFVISFAKKWKGKTKETDWLIKHACRTLLKQGDTEVMALFGFGSAEEIEIVNFHINTPQVQWGKQLEFSVELFNNSDTNKKIRLEYGLYYKKANGSLSRKVFKISEKEYTAQTKTVVNRKHSFRPVTTRTYYEGKHKVSLIINGKELTKKEFELNK